MGKLVTKKLSNGDRLSFHPLSVEDGLRSISLITQYPIAIDCDKDDGKVTLLPDAMKWLLLSLSPEDMNYLQELWFEGALLNGEVIDFDELFAGEYDVLIECMKVIFIENYMTFLTYTANPFERPSFRYDEMVDTIYDTSITDNAVKRIAPFDKITEVIHAIYFSSLCKESLIELKQMTLSEFWMLKVAIDIREAAKQEVDNRSFILQKSLQRKNK